MRAVFTGPAGDFLYLIGKGQKKGLTRWLQVAADMKVNAVYQAFLHVKMLMPRMLGGQRLG